MFLKPFRIFGVFLFLVCISIINLGYGVSGFSGETLVRLNTGKHKQIKDIIEGDLVACYDLVNRKFVYDSVKKVKSESDASFFGIEKYMIISYHDNNGSNDSFLAAYDTLFLTIGIIELIKASNLSTSNTLASWSCIHLDGIEKNETSADSNMLFYNLVLERKALFYNKARYFSIITAKLKFNI